MKFSGGCYCGELRYEAEGEPILKGQCHCRECQYISGGSPNVILALSDDSLAYTKGQPKQFQRTDIENAVIREFCGNCGTPITSLAAGMTILKVGSMDDVSQYGSPDMAIFCIDKQEFHHVPEGIPAFERMPQ
ncbi:MAG: GFA family protein [Pseudomonadota bacterium]